MDILTDSEVKEELLSLLKEITEILDNNGFKYSIWAGTLLGAVRHQGFIPWDDDIDLAMDRCEYDRFLNFVKNNSILQDRFIGFEIGKTDFPFIKYINPRIKVDSPILMDKNLWVDIFPIDNVPINWKRFFKKQRRLNKEYWMYRQEKNKNLPRPLSAGILKKIYNTIYRKIIGLCPQKLIVSRMIDHSKSYLNGEIVKKCCVINGVFEKELFPPYFMESFTTLIFEGYEVKAIKNYKKWLSIRYGNYMKLPPEKQRVTHEITAYRV